MTVSPEPRITLEELTRSFMHHKRKICIFFVSVVLLVSLVTLFSKRIYRSEGKLLVRLGRENVTLDATSTLGNTPVVAVPTDREHEINSVVQILRSRVLAESVVDAIGPHAILKPGQAATNDTTTDQSREKSSLTAPTGFTIFEPLTQRDRAILKFMKNLDVSAVKDSNILSVSYEASNRELSQRAVEKLMSFFLDQHIRLHRTPGSHRFLTQQMERSKAELTAAEIELRDLKNKTGLAAPADQRKLLVDRISRLEDELLQAAAILAATETEQRLSLLALRSGPNDRLTAENDGVADDSMDGMRGQLYTLQLKEQELLAKLTEDEPEVQQVRRQIAASKVVLDREEQQRRRTKWPRATYEKTQIALLEHDLQLESLKAKSAKIKEQLKTTRDDLRTLNANELRIQRLERQVQIQDNTYRKYADNLEQANIDEALALEHISNISVVQPSQSYIKPVRPRKLLNLILAIAFGLFGGLALAVLCEQFGTNKQTLASVEDQQAVPVRASLPQTKETDTQRNGDLNSNGKN